MGFVEATGNVQAGQLLLAAGRERLKPQFNKREAFYYASAFLLPIFSRFLVYSAWLTQGSSLGQL